VTPGSRLAAVALFALSCAPASAQPPRLINISPYDYPSDVQPGARSLRVEVRYELGPDGRFALCAVTKSSGQPSLDAASCRLLQQRARFRPERRTRRGRLELNWMGEAGRALNPAGAPIPVSLHDEISSDDYPPAALSRHESGLVEYDVDVSASGVPRRCTVTQSSGSEALDRRTCEIVMERSAFIPASNGAGGSAAGVYRSRIRWRLAEGG
jgi:TonB family protein